MVRAIVLITAVIGLNLFVNVQPSFANCNAYGYAPPGGGWGKKSAGACAEGAWITYHWQVQPGSDTFVCAQAERQNPVDQEYIDTQWASAGCGDSGEVEYLVCPSHHQNCISLGHMRFKSGLFPFTGASVIWYTTQ